MPHAVGPAQWPGAVRICGRQCAIRFRRAARRRPLRTLLERRRRWGSWPRCSDISASSNRSITAPFSLVNTPHEVGHYVQKLIGATSIKFKRDTENQTFMRVELQADCLAGF